MMKTSKTMDLCYIAMGAVIITISAWIMIPLAVPITLQTMGIFLVLMLLGGKRGVLSILLYIMLGVVGLPVFSGFAAGPGVLFNVTGGYIVGFLIMGLIFWIVSASSNQNNKLEVISLIIGMVICYILGALWYAIVSGGIDLYKESLVVSVLPFVIPDFVKLSASVFVAKAIKKYL